MTSDTPVRYVWALSFASLFMGLVFFVVAEVSLYLQVVAAYAGLLSGSLVILGIVLLSSVS